MAELMDKQGILDELNRRNGAQQPQTPLMDKDQILLSLQKRASVQSAKPEVSPYTDPGSSLLANRGKLHAPLTGAQQPQQENPKWFQSGAFADGYQFGDLSKTWFGTQKDVRENLYSGVVGAGEKALDFLMSIAPYLSGASPWSETAVSAPMVHQQAQRQQLESAKDLVSGVVEKDLIDEQKVAQTMDKITGGIGNLALIGEKADDVSVLGEKTDSIMQSLGQMALTKAMGGMVPWWVVTGATSLGGEAENAVRQGASLDQAVASGLVSAGAEVLSEKLFGGSGLGEKGFLNLDALTSGIANKLWKTLADYGVDMASEGLEEVFSSVVSNLGSALYREEKLVDILASEEALQEYLDSFVSAAVVSGMMNVGKVGSSIANKTDYRNGLTAQQQKVFDQQYDAAIKAAEKSGKLTREQRAAIYDATLESVMAQQPQSATQGEEAAKPEKVPTQAETGAGGQKTAQTVQQTATSNQQTMTPQQAMQETIAEIIGVPSVSQAVESYRESGTVTNKQAEAIASDANAVQELLEMAGIAKPSTKSQTRAAVKQAIAKLAQESVDNTPTGDYDRITNQGGDQYAGRYQQAESVYPGGIQRDTEADSQGEAAGGAANGSAYAGYGAQSRIPGTGNQGDVYAQNSGERELTPALRQKLSGTSVVDSTGEPVAVYHTTDNTEFETFAKGDTGFHFGSEAQANTHRQKRGYTDGRTIRAYLDIKNPIKARMDIMGWNPNGTALYLWGEGLLTDAERQQVDALWKPGDGYDSASAAKLREILESKGYDGIVYPNGFEGDGVSYMVFRDEQIVRAGETRFSQQKPAQTSAKTSGPAPNESVGAAPAGFSGSDIEEAQSKVIDNTYRNATDEEMRRSGEEALKEDPDIGTYYVSKEKDSVRFAEARTETPEQIEYEYNYLMENGINSAEDNDTAMLVRKALFAKNDPRYADIVRLQKLTGTQSGQIIQSFAKYTRMTAEDAAAEVVVEMDKLNESDVPNRFYRDGGFDKWKGDVITSSMNIAKQIDSVEDGDVDGMKDIIRSMAKWRKTTAWFGLSSNLSKAAEAAMKDIDFETAKAIANAQLSTLPTDFKKRPVGQVVKTIRIHNMLSALTTINRNLVGNTAVGFIDATSDSTSGRLIDALISKVTGKRTVGNDIKHGKTYMDAAWKATKMASLCAELDIPMDSESRFTTGTTRTYSPQGNPVMRFMSAYEKYMKYALEVTDQFYQGGANAAVDASLQEISGNGTLTQEEAQAVAKLAGQRRTLKDERAATRMAKKVRQGLNEFGTENMGLGDLTMPFASIGSTSAHVAVDYTAGAVTGLAQVFKLMHDVKSGRYVNGVKTIYKNGKPVRTITLAEAQRAAVTNAGRGITGLGLVTAFAGMAAAGILKVHDDKDKDKRGLEQAQNLSGAQLNIDAALRGMQGKSTDWQADDLVISVDFLEPFNAQMYLGYLLSQEESVLDAVAASPKNAYQSVMSSIADMPAMQGMQEALDLLNGTSSLEEFAASAMGSTASGFIPGWLRQTAQVIDPYYRDTSGDTQMDAAINQVKAAIPGLSQTLPKKYSGIGQEQLRDDDWISGIFNTMVNPGDADRIKTTEVTEFLDELYDLTGDLGIYPDAAAPKSFTQDKKTYTISTKEETEIYQKTYGSEVNKLYSEIIKSADFKGLDETDQAAVLEKAKDAARALAKSKISGKYTPPSSIKNKPIYKSDAQAILDAYIEAKRKAEKDAQKEAAREAYWAAKNGQ